MGLIKETRDFFTNRIFKVLDEKKEKIYKGIDEEKVKKLCVSKLEKECGLEGIFERYKKLEEEKSDLDKKERKLSNEILNGLTGIGKTGLGYYSFNRLFDAFKEIATDTFEKDVLDGLYPKEQCELRDIQKLKEDVRGVVLLATTEPKLVASLNKVLKNYGGDIDELLELLPKE